MNDTRGSRAFPESLVIKKKKKFKHYIKQLSEYVGVQRFAKLKKHKLIRFRMYIIIMIVLLFPVEVC